MDLVPGRHPALTHAARPHRWAPGCDFGAVADGLSALMPHLEPVAVRAVRDTLPLHDDPALSGAARAWARQEAAHQREHRRYNDALLSDVPRLGFADRLAAAAARAIDSRGLRARMGFTCGFEAVAYAVARWVEPRMGELFRGADPSTASLFLWHLAEEVEHKSVVHDVHVATGGGAAGRFVGGLAALAVIGPLTLLGALAMLAHAHRLRRPGTWWRILVWAVSFAFTALTAVGMLALPGHRPDDLADPLWYRQFLRGTHPRSGVLEPWVPPGTLSQGRPSAVSNGPVTS